MCLLCDFRDVDETKSWMNEKDTALLSDDYGRDLASVQALQRKHDGLERDLAALEDKVHVALLRMLSYRILLYSSFPSLSPSHLPSCSPAGGSTG